jgi:translocation and assembly module TamB
MEITASGNSKVSGNTRQGSLEGNLEINDAEYYISGLGGSTSYSGFTIVEKGASGRVEAEREQTPYVLELALSLKADDGIFVRGPQLETEWAGDIQISGSAHDPKVRGEMRVVRGQFQLLNSPVALNKGKVRFTGPDPANPLLDLSGTIRGKEIDASVNVTGEAKSPEFSLSSDPPLPEDEILARAIFGTTTGNLSPVQALKLANMLSVLSGRGGGGMDPLSRLRQAIGLDTLNIGYEEGGATLSVGKYISEDVYIAVDQGVSPESAGVRAEIDVTRDVEVETKFGSTDNSSVGINWKRDY